MALLRSGTRIYGNATIDTNLVISGSTAATSNSSGALQVSGGIGLVGNVYTTANVYANNITASNLLNATDAVISGNLTVNGSAIYANVTSVKIKDPIVEQGGNTSGGALASNDGKDRGQILHYYSSSAVDAFMGWDNSNAEFAFGSNVSVASEVVTFNSFGNLRAGYFIGNGSSLSSITGANVTGAVSTATTAGTVTTAAQPNITSVGTLSSLSVSGTITAGSFLGPMANGSSNVSISPLDGNVSITVAGNTTFVVSDVGANITGNLGITGNITASYVKGNGSSLTSITGANVTGFVPNANVSNTAYAVSGSNVTGAVAYATTANSVAVGNVSGIGNIATINKDGNASNILYGNGVFASAPGGSSYGNSNVATYLPTYTGNLSPGNLTISSSNLFVTGGNANYVLSTDGTGNLSWVAAGGLTTTVDAFTGDGSNTAFTLSVTPTNANYTIAVVHGMVQPKSTYTLSGNVLTFSSAPADTAKIEITSLSSGGAGGGGSSGASINKALGITNFLGGF